MRQASESGFYHVMQRGNAHGVIFESDDDKRMFLRLLKKNRDRFGLRIIAWVLMSDHYHLIVDDPKDNLSKALQCLNRAYVVYFNATTERDGHLFQGRFLSVPILTDRQLIATIHYVHQNPEAAGMASAHEYHWSSLQECKGKRYVVDVDFVLDLFGGLESMLAYRGNAEDAVTVETGERGFTDEQAITLIKELYGNEAIQILRSTDFEARDQMIRVLRRQGLSVRRLARIAQVGRYTIEKICHQ